MRSRSRVWLLRQNKSFLNFSGVDRDAIAIHANENWMVFTETKPTWKRSSYSRKFILLLLKISLNILVIKFSEYQVGHGPVIPPCKIWGRDFSVQGFRQPFPKTIFFRNLRACRGWPRPTRNVFRSSGQELFTPKRLSDFCPRRSFESKEKICSKIKSKSNMVQGTKNVFQLFSFDLMFLMC